MTLIQETPTLYVIQVKPLKEIDQAAFCQADVLLDKQKFLPDAIKLWVPNRADHQIYRFTGEGCYIRPNVPVDDKNFEGLELKGWDVIRNPNPAGRPLAGNAVGAQAPAPRGVAPVARAGQVAPRR